MILTQSSEDGIWFGTSEPDDSKGALLYDTYEIEELACESNKGMKLIPAFEVVVSRNKVTIDLGTLTDEYEKEITMHTTATDNSSNIPDVNVYGPIIPINVDIFISARL